MRRTRKRRRCMSNLLGKKMGKCALEFYLAIKIFIIHMLHLFCSSQFSNILLLEYLFCSVFYFYFNLIFIFIFIPNSFCRLRIRLPDPSELPRPVIPRMDHANRADAPVRDIDVLSYFILFYFEHIIC